MSFPTNPSVGQTYSTVGGTQYRWTGNQWLALGGQTTNTATNITVTPTGSITATHVQDALEQLDTGKLSKGGGTLTGALNLSANKIANVADPIDPSDVATKSYVDQTSTITINQASSI